MSEVDRRLPAARSWPLSLQHVLIMYAGAVTVPLVVGRALKLDPETLAILINADLVACGLATLVQTLGLPGIGIRLPILMGVTFASVSPMLALIGVGFDEGRSAPDLLRAIYGAVIVAGLFGLLIAPFIGRLSRLFPPTVTGTVILLIGLSLMRVAFNWVGGGSPGSPGYGEPVGLAIAFGTLLLILLVMRVARGVIRSAAVLIGIAAGTLLAAAAGRSDFSPVADASWFALVRPFQFGLPTFEAPIVVAMGLVMGVVMIESFGMFLAVGEIVGRPATRADLVRGLRGDALGTVIGGVFNTFPYTSYAQNVGLLTVTGVRSRFVCAGAGVILLLLGLCPKLASIAAAVPVTVLGGAGLVMFGMIAATGIGILAKLPLTFERLVVIAVSVAVGLIPVLADRLLDALPSFLAPLLHSGIVLSAISAVILNLVFLGESDAPHG